MWKRRRLPVAKVRIALGGEFDAVTSDEHKSGLSALRDELLAGSQTQKRIMRPLSQSLTSPPTVQGQTAQIVLGRPAAGRVWVLTRLTVMGADDFTAATNLVASLYVGDDSNIGLSQCVRTATVFPFTTTENERAYVIHDRETLFVNITATGAATITQVVVNGLAWEYKDQDIDTQVI
jgi:hypothetical protein